MPVEAYNKTNTYDFLTYGLSLFDYLKIDMALTKLMTDYGFFFYEFAYSLFKPM